MKSSSQHPYAMSHLWPARPLTKDSMLSGHSQCGPGQHSMAFLSLELQDGYCTCRNPQGEKATPSSCLPGIKDF